METPPIGRRVLVAVVPRELGAQIERRQQVDEAPPFPGLAGGRLPEGARRGGASALRRPALQHAGPFVEAVEGGRVGLARAEQRGIAARDSAARARAGVESRAKSV